jgi:hypothetical protein
VLVVDVVALDFIRFILVGSREFKTIYIPPFLKPSNTHIIPFFFVRVLFHNPHTRLSSIRALVVAHNQRSLICSDLSNLPLFFRFTFSHLIPY